MRVLHLTTEPPWFPGGPGGATRQYRLLRRLVELGHEVTVVCPLTAGQLEATNVERTLREAGVGFRPVVRPSNRGLEVLRATARDPLLVPGLVGRPLLAWQAGVFWAQARPVALEVAERQRPDVAVVEHDHLAGWARDLPPELPSVLTAHNVTWRLFESRGLRAEAARHRRYAARHLGRYAAVVAVSGRDAGELERLGARRVEVVPNGAPTDELVPSPDAPQPPTLLFTGSMDHAPNREGILWFAERVWPLVRERVPGARLVIVGRGPQEALRPLAADASIELAGEVPAVAPYFERATAVVAPLLSGGGTRIKILEALAAGRAVAATRVGAEGLELEAGTHLLVADGAEALAEAAASLLTDAELRGRLAREGRSAVERRYDWRACGDHLERVLLSVAGRGG